MMRRERAGGGQGGTYNHPSPMAVRYVYVALFLVANIFALVARENHIIFFEGQRLSTTVTDCLAVEDVMHQLFSLVMFFTTIYTRKVQLIH